MTRRRMVEARWAWAFVAVVLAVLFAKAHVRPWWPLEFDAERWRTDVGGLRPERYRMADGLVTSGRLVGETADEVRALLGSPLETIEDGTAMVFDAGAKGLSSCPLFDFDPFDVGSRRVVVRTEDGVVAEAVLVED
ncbi:MAG: hypothetical protein ACF8XB_18650 [Planctomycetota bacterium JB042]